MILSDQDIKRFISEGQVSVTPYREQLIEPASIDLTLGNHFLLPISPKDNVQSLKDPIQYDEVVAKTFTIPGKSFVLATTQECVKLSNMMTGFVEGRSSIGRAGLFIQNAGWVDPGFEGHITLELFNANDFSLKIEENQRICQLVIARTHLPAISGYNGKYQRQVNTTGSKVFMDFEKY